MVSLLISPKCHRTLFKFSRANLNGKGTARKKIGASTLSFAICIVTLACDTTCLLTPLTVTVISLPIDLPIIIFHSSVDGRQFLFDVSMSFINTESETETETCHLVTSLLLSSQLNVGAVISAGKTELLKG
ncbi:hypothetical protein ES708_34308 [subsurface metagenome]